jgi:hypothetical protein
MSGLTETHRLRRLRQVARRAGRRIERSKISDIHLDDFGGFQIVDNRRNCVILGSKFELELPDLEAFLLEVPHVATS